MEKEAKSQNIFQLSSTVIRCTIGGTVVNCATNCAPYLLHFYHYMSLVMRKPAFCICASKDADQLCGNREADQRLCFCYTDSTIPLLLKYEISHLWPSYLIVQSGLCRTWLETQKTGFRLRRGSNLALV